MNFIIKTELNIHNRLNLFIIIQDLLFTFRNHCTQLPLNVTCSKYCFIQAVPYPPNGLISSSFQSLSNKLKSTTSPLQPHLKTAKEFFSACNSPFLLSLFFLFESACRIKITLGNSEMGACARLGIIGLEQL